MIKAYFKLTKMGITVFALISAAAGFILALLHSPSATFHMGVFLWFLIGLYFVIGGSFILNQSYEEKTDALMKRTQHRPVPSGQITKTQAFALGVVHIVPGVFILLALHPLTAGLSLLALILYNICYTMYWKKKWIFAAVPGALPGALPVMIGYSAVSTDVLSLPCLYLLMVLFLWQMPHFWSLALHYRLDYKKASIPVLPLYLSPKGTLYHIGFYLLAYLGLMLVSPLLFHMNLGYLFLLLPLCAKVFFEFLKFANGMKWKPFFIWLNVSVLVFLWTPALDIWLYKMLIQG